MKCIAKFSLLLAMTVTSATVFTTTAEAKSKSHSKKSHAKKSGKKSAHKSSKRSHNVSQEERIPASDRSGPGYERALLYMGQHG